MNKCIAWNIKKSINFPFKKHHIKASNAIKTFRFR